MQLKTLGALAFLVSSVSFAASGCGKNADGPDDEGDSGGDSDSDGISDDGDNGVNQKSCTSSAECVGASVCHPSAQICVTPGAACEDSSGCPGGNYCEPSLNRCLPGLTGSPCESDENCAGESSCTDGVCGCSEFSEEQETSGALDIYFILDRTASMGNDCDYVPGGTPPGSSKACYATYALNEYLINVSPEVDTRLAFQWMSLQGNCNATPYATPLVGLTQLPVSADHQLIEQIADENFNGGFGTRIEPTLHGIAAFTAANQTPGREMIGVLMTDGDPSNCITNIGTLAQIIADHLEETGIRTFIIGMNGATESNLEQLAAAGGAEPHDDFCGDLEPPCHYWNVGDGEGDAIANALQAIAQQAVPLACEYPLASVQPPSGMSLDPKTLNIRLTEVSGESTILFQVPSEDDCPAGQPAWYYDNPASPQNIQLCNNACELVSGADSGARISIVGGCSETQVLK